MKIKFFPLVLLLSLFAVFINQADAAETRAIVDPSTHKRDYTTIATVTQREYPGTLAGNKKKENYEAIKWYINAFFVNQEGNVLKAFSGPAALLVKKGRLDEFKPRLLQFIPRVATASEELGWDHELLALEGNNLVKYNLWAEEDQASGKFTASVDMLKRTPIAMIDVSYEPWADKDGNIFYKRDGKFLKCDPVSESSKPLIAEPKKETPNQLFATIEGDSILTKWQGHDEIKVSQKANFDIIDPLALDDEKLIAPYQGLGTASNPVDHKLYELIIQGHVAPGMILALNNVANIVGKPPLSDTQKIELKEMLKTRTEAFEKSKELIKELKQVMREKGAQSLLKKWITDDEYRAILIALDPSNGASRGISMTHYTRGPKKGLLSFDHNGHVKMVEDGLQIPWGLYRSYKDAVRKGMLNDFKYWESFAPEKAKTLKAAILGYPAKIIGDHIEFLKVLAPIKDKDLSYFEKENKDIRVELALDYLASLSEDKLNEILAKLSDKKVEQAKYKNLLSRYKTTTLSAVK